MACSSEPMACTMACTTEPMACTMRFYAVSIVIVWEMGQIYNRKFKSMDITLGGGATTDSVTCPGHKFQFGAASIVNKSPYKIKCRAEVNSGLLVLENEFHLP